MGYGYPPGVCPMAFWVMLQKHYGIWVPHPRCLPHGILGNVAKHYGIWVPPCGQTDRHVSKHNLPVVLCMQAVTRKSSCMNAKGMPTYAWCIKYSISYPRWGTTPSAGYPQPGLMGGTQGGVPPTGYPQQSNPQPHLTGGTQGGVPPPPAGYPLQPGPMGVGTQGGILPVTPSWGTPPSIWTWPGYPPRCGQTDMCQNITFPSYYVCGR